MAEDAGELARPAPHLCWGCPVSCTTSQLQHQAGSGCPDGVSENLKVGTYYWTVWARVEGEWSEASKPRQVRVSCPEGRLPVIFIPGLYGSTLESFKDKHFDTLWLTRDECMVSRLRPDDNGTGPASEDVRVQGVLGSYLGRDIYGGFIDWLRNNFGEVVEFPYDWRMDLTSQVEALANKIAGSDPGCVHIVAHSMGGLLAKAFLTQDPANESKVRRVIFIGTPHFGAPKAILGLTEGIDDFNGWFTIEGWAVGLPGQLLAYVARNSPAAYQLLPSERLLSRRGFSVCYATLRGLWCEIVDPLLTPVNLLTAMDCRDRAGQQVGQWKGTPYVRDGSRCQAGSLSEGMNRQALTWSNAHETWDTWAPSLHSNTEAFILYGTGRTRRGQVPFLLEIR